MNEILVPLTAVDLIDRLAVLTLASENGGNGSVLQQRDILRRTIDRVLPADDELCALRKGLYDAYADLETLRGDLRRCEDLSDFGPGFVALTRSYLEILDQRDQIKSDIAARLRQIQMDSTSSVSPEKE
ncbi:hypothetical protein [Yoonia sp. R2-816]|uniref:hypothetical protein n=1 Tax=Yoonia sp. R2-816 TaxID=3342638 RepID=UPI00372C2A98